MQNSGDFGIGVQGGKASAMTHTIRIFSMASENSATLTTALVKIAQIFSTTVIFLIKKD